MPEWTAAAAGTLIVNLVASNSDQPHSVEVSQWGLLPEHADECFVDKRVARSLLRALLSTVQHIDTSGLLLSGRESCTGALGW